MSDLISRSALLKLFEDKMFNDKLMNPVIKMSDVIEIIEEQPIAYDKEAVVEQLEEVSNKYCSPRHLDCEGCGYYASEEAIGIVKAGGIDEMLGKDV